MPELDEALKKEERVNFIESEENIRFFTIPCFCPKEKSIRFAALFQCLGEKTQERVQKTKNILKRLKFDNDTTERTVSLVHFCDLSVVPEKAWIRKKVYEMGEEIFPMVLILQKANVKAQYHLKQEEVEKKKERLKQTETLYEEIIKDGDCLSLKTLAVTGKDLIEAGLKPGKELGNCLQKLLQDVLEHPEHNTKEYLLYSVLP